MPLWLKKNIYLDYASATPVDRRVLRILSKTERKFFANGSAIYKTGVLTKRLINESRLNIAKSLNAHADEIIFTGSGTESDALAIIGVVNYFKNIFPNIKPHIIVSEIEHPAILENVKLLEIKKIIEVSFAPVLPNGILDVGALKDLIKDNTVLVSVMYANNEIGTIQPIEEIAKVIRKHRKDKDMLRDGNVIYPVFHTDSCQAMNYLFTENIEKLGVDLLTFNSSKIYGPKGIGVLVKKRGVGIEKIYSGGGQEFGLRSGTESVALISGIAEALMVANKIKTKESERLIKIRDYGIKKLLELSDVSGCKIILNGDKENRLPNNINISIEGISSELLVIELSAKGIFVSEKSACKSEDHSKSHVIGAIRKNSETKNETDGSLRISLGRQTKREDMDSLVKNLKKILEKYKIFKK